jgi:manganese/zinc/iron transport system substrate-binding protein
MNKLMNVSLILMTFFLLNCTDDKPIENADGTKKLKVTSTTGMITDALKSIAGDKIELVATICGPGIDPHSYIPTTKDIVNINKSDLIIYNGLNLEAKMGEILGSQGKDKAFAIGDAIPIDSLINNSEKSNILDYDPHVWNDPMLWIYSLYMLVDVLVEKDSSNAEFYRENGEKYIDEVIEAYKYAKEKYSQIPKNQRVLISEHDAFQYFAKAYDFEVMSVLGMNTDSEAGIRVIQELSDYVVRNKVKSAFIETIINQKGIQALQNAVKSKKWDINIAEKPLYSDALGQNPPTDTFVGVIIYNADVIYEALK